MKGLQQHPLYAMVNPRSLAFFGASNRFSAMGTNQLHSVLSLGFEGPIYPVHPQEKQVLGLTAYQDVMDLPEVPDLAVMVLPTSVVPETLERCGRKGIKRAVIVSGGFNEVGGQGPELQKEIKDIAGRYGIRFLGPNCLGVVNPYHKFNMTFLPFTGQAGFIGFASQSGSFITQMFDYLAGLGIGFSTGFSVGNEADMDIVDCLEYLAQCPHTRVIGLYIEAIRRGRAFIETARRIVPHKPIVAFYVGGSELGKRAGLSHTGALAGPDKLYDGVFRQAGILRARSMTELFDFCLVLGSSPLPQGKRVVIQTHSGGPGAVAADACGRAGLELPAFSPETVGRLAPYVPQTGSLNNPVDLTYARNLEDYFKAIPETLLSEPRADGLLLYLMLPSHPMRRVLSAMGVAEDQIQAQIDQMVAQMAEYLIRLTAEQTKPIIGFSYRARVDKLIGLLQQRGFPVLPSPHRAARAMDALVRYRHLRERFGRQEDRISS
jgi:acetate---CoA ligase (ADP-forming) subunit alpha